MVRVGHRVKHRRAMNNFFSLSRSWAASVLITLLAMSPTGAVPALADESPSGAAAPAAGEKTVPAPSSSPSLPAASADAPAEVTELWTGSLYTSTFRVGLCFSAQGKVRGVLHLHLANGQVDVYHFEGSVKDNAIEASHPSGHKFKGRLSAPDKVEGTISLKNGMKIKLEGKRVQDVPLASEDCAPLPE